MALNPQINPNYAEIGLSFARYYYQMYEHEQNRAEVANLFDATAFYTSESTQAHGREEILKAILAVQFKKIQHVITCVDSQPTLEGGVISVVTGQLQTDDDPPHSFTQVFCLKPDAGGNFLCMHSFFRLMLHNM